VKVLVVGASRGLGRETVKAALAAGHEVTAFARHPEVLNLKHGNLRLRTGNVLDISSVKQAVEGQDVVICALGLPTRRAIGPPLAKRSYVLSKGVANIVAAMTASRVKRLICVTAIGTGDSIELCTPLTKLVLRHGLRWLFKEKDRQEELIKATNLDWTLIRPTALTNGKAKGAKIGEVRSGLLTQVSRADVAAGMIKMIGDKNSYQKALVISYPPRLGDSVRWVFGYFGLG
jgi:putative NADH-flavin reductase